MGKHKVAKKSDKYSVEGNRVVKKRTCPKCGPGVFLAKHQDRMHCGRCGYTEFPKTAPAKEQPAEKKEVAKSE